MGKINFIFCVGVILLLGACVSTPKLQKSVNGSEGYTVQNLDRKERFRVSFNIPKDLEFKFVVTYKAAAVGTECKERGFNYSDHADDGKDAEGFCYATPNRVALGISFKGEGLKKNPRQFVVEGFNGKKQTRLKLGDEILAVNNKPLTSMTQIKITVFEASLNKQTALQLKIKRQGKLLQVSETLAVFPGFVLDQDALETFQEVF